MPSWANRRSIGPDVCWQVSNASRLPSYQMTEPLREGGEAHVSGMPFRLDIVETGEQWVVTCATPHGKAVSRIPAPFSTDVLHRVLADIEKALIRSYSPVTTRRAAPVDQAVREFGETLSDADLDWRRAPPVRQMP